MEDASGTGFSESTSKICWFSLSSLLFKSSSQTEPTTQQSQSQQAPTSTPIQRRTSPRLSNKSKSNSSSSSLPKTSLESHCCFLTQSSTENAKNCTCKSSPKALKKNNSNSFAAFDKLTNSSDNINSSKKQIKIQTQQSVKTSGEDNELLSSVSNDPHGHLCCQGHHHKLTHGLSNKEAPHYLTFNPYITGGYRNNLTPTQCIRSLFWWTNETLNIWSHLIGWVFFFTLSVYDGLGLLDLPKTQPWDQAIFSLLLICFQACMILSAAYHVFCCCSEQSYRQWLSMDLLGVSLSLLAIYISGIYYAFSCVPSWLNFYLSTVAAIFVCCLTCTFLRSSDGFSNRLVLFGGWACYGIVPTVHWAILHGGFKSSAVALILPRIFWMYAISAAAFFFYVSKLPERWKPGLVNYIGSSHQIWHVLIVAALYHWHNTGLVYLNYRSQHPCSEEYAALYPTANE